MKPHYVWSWRYGGWVGPFRGVELNANAPRVIYRYEHDARWIGRGFWEAFDIGFEMLCASGALA